MEVWARRECCGELAQLGERLVCIQEVTGSSPVFSLWELRLGSFAGLALVSFQLQAEMLSLAGAKCGIWGVRPLRGLSGLQSKATRSWPVERRRGFAKPRKRRRTDI